MGLEKLSELQDEYQKNIKEQGQKAISAALKELFDTYPELHRILWRQYTPYFNDGDICEFSVYDVYILLEGDKDQEDEEGERASYSIRDTHPGLSKALRVFEQDLQKNPDALKYVFGDHAKVTCTRSIDGDPNVEIEEYEHE